MKNLSPNQTVYSHLIPECGKNLAPYTPVCPLIQIVISGGQGRSNFYEDRPFLFPQCRAFKLVFRLNFFLFFYLAFLHYFVQHYTLFHNQFHCDICEYLQTLPRNSAIITTDLGPHYTTIGGNHVTYFLYCRYF